MACQIIHDEWNGDWDCGYGSVLDCGQCKYGGGRKDPAAWVNAPPEDRAEHAKQLRDARKQPTRPAGEME